MVVPSSDDGRTEVHRRGVVLFDASHLIDKCRSDSTRYDSGLCNFKVISNEVFKDRGTWKNRDILQNVMSTIGALEGWAVHREKCFLTCNRRSRTDRKPVGLGSNKRQLSDVALEKSECQFHLKLKPCIRKKSTSAKSKTKTDCWDGPCKISSSCLEHSGYCTPGPTNLVSVKAAAGCYQKHISTEALYSLCRCQEINMKLTIT